MSGTEWEHSLGGGIGGLVSLEGCFFFLIVRVAELVRLKGFRLGGWGNFREFPPSLILKCFGHYLFFFCLGGGVGSWGGVLLVSG